MKVFGPVPSRRLGRSVGVNNIPAKICTYSCVYCQLGRSLQMTIDRQAFYAPEELQTEVTKKINRLTALGEDVDYLTIVPDGEPTLDVNLGRLLELLRPLNIKLAVITNGSLLHLPEVRAALAKADWVSLKVDAVDVEIWKKIDRPHDQLELQRILKGMLSFVGQFKGLLVTETMLVKNVNDQTQQFKRVAEFIRMLKPETAYLSIPTRPPAENWVAPPDESALNTAFQIFSDQGINTEYLVGYEGNRFAFTGDVEQDILSITAVHPMREDAVRAYLQKAGRSFGAIEKLIADGKLIVREYQNKKYFLRRLQKTKK